MAKATQPVSINDLEFDALIEESHGYEATVPEYAVENGFPVSDHIVFSAETLDMTLYVTNTPVTWFSTHGGDTNRVATVIAKLEEIYYAAEPVTIVTTDRTYTNMAITSIKLSKTVSVGYAREIPISFKRIRVAQAETTTIPSNYGKSGATSAQAGTASTSKATSKTSSSKKSSSSGTSSSSGSTSSSSGSSGSSSKSNSSSSSKSSGKSSILYGAASNLGLL